jgi:hypothetical protein
MSDWIKNGVLRETPNEDLVYKSISSSIESKGKNRLVMEIGKELSDYLK